jgi:hypothetical protein
MSGCGGDRDTIMHNTNRHTEDLRRTADTTSRVELYCVGFITWQRTTSTIHFSA